MDSTSPASPSPARSNTNPIFKRYFEREAFVSSKTFDGPRSLLFRKQLAMWQWLEQCKPSSRPSAGLVERIGDRAIHHVFWLEREGSSLRNSLAYREGRRGPRWAAKAEASTRVYLNTLHRTLARLKSLFK